MSELAQDVKIDFAGNDNITRRERLKSALRLSIFCFYLCQSFVFIFNRLISCRRVLIGILFENKPQYAKKPDRWDHLKLKNMCLAVKTRGKNGDSLQTIIFSPWQASNDGRLLSEISLLKKGPFAYILWVLFLGNNRTNKSFGVKNSFGNYTVS